MFLNTLKLLVRVVLFSASNRHRGARNEKRLDIFQHTQFCFYYSHYGVLRTSILVAVTAHGGLRFCFLVTFMYIVMLQEILKYQPERKTCHMQTLMSKNEGTQRTCQYKYTCTYQYVTYFQNHYEWWRTHGPFVGGKRVKSAWLNFATIFFATFVLQRFPADLHRARGK